VALLALIFSTLSRYFNISFILIFLIFTTLIIFLLAYQFKFKIRLFLISIATFTLFHLIIFPCIYVLILNNNPNSIAFDSQVQTTEKKNALTELNYNVKPNEKNNLIKILKKILTENSPKLDSTLSSLKNKNIVKLKDYLIYTQSEIIPKGKGFLDRNYFVICNNTGKHISTIANDSIDFFTSKLKIKDFILKTQKEEILQIKKFKNEERNIKKVNNFWNFKRIIPY
jgi:energy-coupling factor transporter transmembrane protein EcfT